MLVHSEGSNFRHSKLIPGPGPR